MLRINETTLFDVTKPGWLDSDQIRLKTAGVVIDQGSVPPQGGRRLLAGGYPVGKDPDPESGKYIPARRASFVLGGYTGDKEWGILCVAKETGEDGEDITIELLDPGTASASLAVAVTGNAIEVSLATGPTPGKAIISKAQEVVTALLGNDDAMALLGLVAVTVGPGIVVSAKGPENLLGGVDAEFLTLADVEVTDGDNSVAVLDQGRVVIGGLPLGVDGLPVYDAGVAEQLPGITFVS